MSEVPEPSAASADPHLTGQGAFDAFAAPYLPILRAIAAREVGLGNAEDILQDALLRAWQRWDTYDESRGTPKVWLCAIVLDRARRGRPILRRFDSRLDGIERTLDVADVTDVRLDTERAIRKLPRKQRLVVTLHYLADLSVDDVAQVLGLSVGSVKSNLFDARTNLRKIIAKGDSHE